MNDDRKKKNIIQTLCSYVYMTAYEKKATKVVTLRSSWKMLEALHSVELSLILSDSHTNDISTPYHGNSFALKNSYFWVAIERESRFANYKCKPLWTFKL